MPQPQGSDFRLAMFDETVYATDPGAPDGTLLPVKSFPVVPDANLIDSEVLTGNRARERPGTGNKKVAGDIETELAGQWFGKIAKHALGVSAPTGAGPYVHTATLGALPVSFMLEKDYGSAIVIGRYEKHNGCRIGSLGFQFPVEGPVMLRIGVVGAKMVESDTPLDATVTDLGHTSFFANEGTPQEGGGAVATFQSGELTLTNELDESVFAWGGGGVRRSLPAQRVTINGTGVFVFEDKTILAKAIAGTASSFKWTLSRGTGLGSAGNEFIEILAQNILYQPTSVPIQGPQGLMLTANFRTFRVGANHGLQIITKNAVATV